MQIRGNEGRCGIVAAKRDSGYHKRERPPDLDKTSDFIAARDLSALENYAAPGTRGVLFVA